MRDHTAERDELGKATWRFKLGILLICLVGAAWLIVPALAWAGASAGTIATATGIIFIWNKVVILITVAVMGKPGFQQLKSAVFGVFRLGPKSIVGPLRYNVGLVMFTVPLIAAILEPYIDAAWPELRPHLWELQLLGDLIFLSSFLVLGGNFWEKIRSLFIRTARVVDTKEEFPTTAS
ncbi:transporter suffix domain-containing protein [Sinorhizobium sp. BG8]|uniref:transporter suffix domain-containing protein n=1 Tax=Sinorhizobium sp. BG8 TaxID=2613773 RepID=UPI00193C9779|nr:transporter suffix domain-containing protein [Sinorhizobium sp. BG8]QRM55312.1 transporter suffix domain-containing protein [Sinorhizobium sp. BG8]